MKDTQTVNMDTAIFQTQKDEQSTGARHNLDSFHTRLRMLAKKQENTNVEAEIETHHTKLCIIQAAQESAEEA